MEVALKLVINVADDGAETGRKKTNSHISLIYIVVKTRVYVLKSKTRMKNSSAAMIRI